MLTDEKIEQLREECLENHIHSYFDEDDLNEKFDEIIDTLKDLDEEITLHRVVFLKDVSDLNKSNLGEFWVQDESLIEEDDFKEYLQHECNGETIEGTGFQIEAIFKKEDVDIEMNIEQYMLNPNEEEITIKPNAKPIGDIKIFDCENNKYIEEQTKNKRKRTNKFR